MDKRSLEREMIPVILYCTVLYVFCALASGGAYGTDAFRVCVLIFISGCVYIQSYSLGASLVRLHELQY